MPIQAVLQGAGLISGIVRVDLLESGRSVNCRIVLRSMDGTLAKCETDQFLFNLTSFFPEKKHIMLNDVDHVSQDGSIRRTYWSLEKDVETSFGPFDYRLSCSLEEGGRPLKEGEDLLFQLQASDEQHAFHEDWFLDAPASTFNGFQAALVIKFPGSKQMLAGGQFEVKPSQS